jgi:hypothetical protein
MAERTAWFRSIRRTGGTDEKERAVAFWLHNLSEGPVSINVCEARAKAQEIGEEALRWARYEVGVDVIIRSRAGVTCVLPKWIAELIDHGGL